MSRKRTVKIEFWATEDDAEESIQFLADMYDSTRDAYYNYLANLYRRALGYPLVHDYHTLTSSITRDAGMFGASPR